MNKIRENNIAKTHLFRSIGRDMYRKMESLIKEDLKKQIENEIVKEISDDIKNKLKIELINENYAYMVELSQINHDRMVLEQEMKLVDQEFIKLNFEKDEFKKEKETFYIEKGLIMENTTINGMDIMTNEDMMDTDIEQDFSDEESNNEDNEENEDNEDNEDKKDNNENESEENQTGTESYSDFEEIN